MPQYVHIVQKPPGFFAAKYQVIFQPTRSRVDATVVLDGVPADQSVATVDDFLLTIKPTIDSNWPNEALVKFEGEPLQEIGFACIEDLHGTIDPDSEFREWVECRKRKPNATPADQFFLDLDLAFHPRLMRYSGRMQPSRAKRCCAARRVTAVLMDRISCHAWDLAPGPIVDADDITAFLIVARKMDDLFKKHFSGDRQAESEACQQFAAGMLQQICKPKDPRIKVTSRLGGYSAGDPDSANLFMFAELACAMMELSDDADVQKRWTDRLEMFALMQCIYLDRWNAWTGRDYCFRQYNCNAPPLMNLPAYPIPALWKDFILGNIRRTRNGGNDCFNIGTLPCDRYKCRDALGP